MSEVKTSREEILNKCEHEWEVTDYIDDTPGSGCVIMRGPVCKKCGAIGEYVLPGGWQEALALTTSELRKDIEKLKLEVAKTRRAKSRRSKGIFKRSR